MLLNDAVLEEVRETLGDAVLQSFLARMLAEVDEAVDALRKLLAVRDYGTLAATAHRVAGSAASVGAVGLHSALKDIENAARRSETVGSLPRLLSALSDRAGETRVALASRPGSD